jgi:hypothetical protein
MTAGLSKDGYVPIRYRDGDSAGRGAGAFTTYLVVAVAGAAPADLPPRYPSNPIVLIPHQAKPFKTVRSEGFMTVR